MGPDILVWRIGLLLVILLGAAIAVVLVGYFLKRGTKGESTPALFRELNASDLSSLKQKGLLTDEEAKRLQSIIARKTLESLEKRGQPSEKRIDMQDLLSEAERLRLKHLQERAASTEDEE